MAEIWNRLAEPPEPGTTRARVRVAWRLTRELALRQGRIREGESLQEAVAAYHTPINQITLTPTDPSKPTYQWIVEMGKIDNEINASYIRARDPITTAEYVWGLFHPDANRRAPWPPLDDLVDYELRLAKRVLDQLCCQASLDVYRQLIRKSGFTPKEARDIISIARKEARFFIDEDQDSLRNMMTLRLQNIQKRARKAFNLREETNALKMEAQINGLGKTAPDNLLDAFAAVVGQAAARPTSARAITYDGDIVSQDEPLDARDDSEPEDL